MAKIEVVIIVAFASRSGGIVFAGVGRIKA